MTFQLQIRTAQEIAETASAAHRARIVALVDDHIEARARSLGYNNAVSCVSYRNSMVQSWVDEAETFSAWRDSVWQTLIALCEAAGDTDTPLPDAETVIASLPAWPD
ncbi:hypothetical protein JI664_04130 [Rhodobacter sp. NTK016B]|uniref:hypothetical protein n=1 Tax=Rhodobacter sp. NTK016B TaxID=2759676 RepID=UPI001A90C9C7|nr:hypothetical protein [Rhodobacter sp. NTK016B]MBN8291147.1 hypothetical protein [Rhodobacter sp. NTK016B]